MTKYVYGFTEGDKDQKACSAAGREPGRDDQARVAGAARVHHHHRGVPGYLAHGSAPVSCGCR